ncbi:MAG TPA: glycosyltransferase family 87 protein, partial [Stellaceae bacterium]|nr:glycosyltransferase family 87 protein [Stellaceae bacterium]
LSRPDWLGSLAAGDFLDRRRVLVLGGVMLALELVVFLFLVAGTHGWIVPLERPTTTDFASFYAAGSLADSGTPALAYNEGAHYAAEQAATAPGIEYQFFYYPPVFLLICALFGRLPYMAAFIAFEAVTLLLCALVAQRIVNGRTLNAKSAAFLLPLLAFPSVFWTMGLGQNAFLTAALFGGALLLIDRRPTLAGVLFGLLCYKPHFGLLIPVALVAGGRWRAFIGAALSGAATVALSIALFGWRTWLDFFTLSASSHATYESGRIDLSGFVTLFGGLRLMNVPSDIAYAVQGIGALAAIALVAVVWRCNLSLPVRAAALAAATLIAVPVGLVYDFLLAGLAMAWLVRAGRESGFLAWEKVTLAAIFVTPLISRNVGTATHVPLAPLALIALMALIARRALHEHKRENDKARHKPGLTSSITI